MLYFVFVQLLSFMLDLFTTSRLSDQEKDVQILALRLQLRILQRKQPQPPRISRSEKCVLATLTVQLKELAKCTGKRLDETILLFKPATVLKWLFDAERLVKAWRGVRSGDEEDKELEESEEDEG